MRCRSIFILPGSLAVSGNCRVREIYEFSDNYVPYDCRTLHTTVLSCKMLERKSLLPGITAIEGSRKYYEVTEQAMNLFASAYPAYHYLLKNFLLQAHPEFEQPNPDLLCVLGGFFPHHSNIEATHALAAEVGISPAQCRYLDINPDPAAVLTDDERTRFHQLDLSKMAEAQTAEGLPLIAEGSVKLMILDHVTEFMDDETLARFFENLSKVLAPDGVALMSTVEAIGKLEQFWEKVKGMFVMKTKLYVRSEQQWRTALEHYLSNPAVLSFPLGNSDRKLYLLSRQNSQYGAVTLRSSLVEEEFDAYTFKLNKKSAPFTS